ncbi:MAG TPA: class I SAM-dependent methyltransferase [Gemmatimonadales bacterium]
MDRRAHWECVYTTKRSDEVSWYQAEPTRSLELLRAAGAGPDTTIVDVGGGDSTLVDAVVAERLGRMTVLDVSAAALARARERLGERENGVTWIEADVTRAELPEGAYDVWHDRAAFHFLTDAEERARYAALAARAVRPGGRLMIATFAADGPTRCSGLEVARYSPEELARELGDAFELERGFGDVHVTPAGKEQRFTVAVLRRR